ncbi:MAG: hypothetical protein QG629_276 [Patescibacteria group bacterium]|nr:hypothetical protein [Candidatus Saccharibacteria bacterium]MDQ5963194.1 hypothetical protein [Patescibacteria group bacterium]
MALYISQKRRALTFLEQYKTQQPHIYAAAQQGVGNILIIDSLTGAGGRFSYKFSRRGIFNAFLGIVGSVFFMLSPVLMRDSLSQELTIDELKALLSDSTTAIMSTANWNMSLLPFFIVGVLFFLISLYSFVNGLLIMITGWRIRRNGYALATTLPVGTDLSLPRKDIMGKFVVFLLLPDGATVDSLNAMVTEDDFVYPSAQTEPLSSDDVAPRQ